MTSSLKLGIPLNLRIAALMIAAAATAVVGGAWLFQFAGYLPCQLCLWQRIPYYIIIPILFVAAVAGPKLSRFTLGLAVVIFLAGAALAIYHSGVEWGFWPGPTSCGAGGDFSVTSTENLLSALETTQPPSCNEAAGRFLGLSFAGWNAVASIGLAFVCFVALRTTRNKANA